jgi:hypothetical protein
VGLCFLAECVFVAQFFAGVFVHGYALGIAKSWDCCKGPMILWPRGSNSTR